jgi:eukaryotic-like serine/threonine-protein kinase
MGERKILDSWKEIADYLRRDVRTCQRYERELGLPVHRLEESARARVFAYADEIDAWREKRRLESPGAVSRFLYAVKSKPLAAVLAVVLVLGLGTLLGLLVEGLLGEKGRRPELSIAVLPVQSEPARAGEPDWARRLTPLLINGLSGSTYFEALSYDRVLGALKDLNLDPAAEHSERDLLDLVQRSGTTHVITPVAFKAGPGRVVALTVRRPGTKEAYSSRHEIADDTGILAAADRMADQIKRDIGLTRTTQAGDFDALGVPVTTSSLEAFRLYNQGRRSHTAGDYAESIQFMRRALKHDPEFAMAWRSLAASLENQGKEKEASDCLEKALEFSPNASIQEQLFIKTMYFQFKSEYGRALQTSLEWVALFPDDTQALLYTGRGYLFVEDPESALRFLEDGLRKGDRNPYMFYYAALAHSATGGFEEAERVCERGMSIHPGNSLIGLAGVINAIVQGRHDRALSEIGKINGERAVLLGELMAGDALLLMGDFPGAEDRYRRLGISSPQAKLRLARLALAEGRYARAAELAAEAGDDVLVAYVEWRRGRPDKGREAAERALKSAEERGDFPKELGALQMKGTLEVAAGDVDAAKATAARLGGVKKTHQEKAQTRALICIEALIAEAVGRSDIAVERYEVAVKALPRDVPYLSDKLLSVGGPAGFHAMVLYGAARAQEKTGQTAAAQDHYLKLVGLNGGRLQHPDLFALSHYALGRIAESQGETARARLAYETFLELWKNADAGLPEVEDARARLAAL